MRLASGISRLKVTSEFFCLLHPDSLEIPSTAAVTEQSPMGKTSSSPSIHESRLFVISATEVANGKRGAIVGSLTPRDARVLPPRVAATIDHFFVQKKDDYDDCAECNGEGRCKVRNCDRPTVD